MAEGLAGSEALSFRLLPNALNGRIEQSKRVCRAKLRGTFVSRLGVLRGCLTLLS